MKLDQHRGGSGEPLVLVHGIGHTWRGWKPMLPTLERSFDVLAVDLPGMGYSAPLPAGTPPTAEALADAVEQAMDDAGFETAHIVGNSLGGYVALQLASRGRARTVVALAPAGGWARGDESYKDLLRFQSRMLDLVKTAAPHAEAAHPGRSARPPDARGSELRCGARADRPLASHGLESRCREDHLLRADRVGHRRQAAAAAAGRRAVP